MPGVAQSVVNRRKQRGKVEAYSRLDERCLAWHATDIPFFRIPLLHDPIDRVAVRPIPRVRISGYGNRKWSGCRHTL